MHAVPHPQSLHALLASCPGRARQGHGSEIGGQEASSLGSSLKASGSFGKNGCISVPPRWLPALSGFWEVCSEVPPSLSIGRVCGALLLLLSAHSHLGGSFTEVFLSRSLLHVCARACAFWPLSLSLKGCLPRVMLTRRRHAGKMSQLNGPEGDSFVRCQACGKIKAS